MTGRVRGVEDEERILMVDAFFDREYVYPDADLSRFSEIPRCCLHGSYTSAVYPLDQRQNDVNIGSVDCPESMEPGLFRRL